MGQGLDLDGETGTLEFVTYALASTTVDVRDKQGEKVGETLHLDPAKDGVELMHYFGRIISTRDQEKLGHFLLEQAARSRRIMGDEPAQEYEYAMGDALGTVVPRSKSDAMAFVGKHPTWKILRRLVTR